MPNQLVYHDDANRKVWEAVDGYFAKAGASSGTNMLSIQPVLDSFDERMVLIVCTQWVIEAIQLKAIENIKLAPFMSGQILVLQLSVIAEQRVSQLKDVARTIGPKIGTMLTSGFGTSSDEDEQALDALLLVDFLQTLAPVQLEATKIFLKNHYSIVVGTSCKMAIAWSLYNMGEKKNWEDLVYGDFFVQSNFVKAVEKVAETVNPKLNKKEIKDLVCRGFATGEYVNLAPFPISEIEKINILRILALDIASNGRAFSPTPKWTRKSKN